MRLGIILLTHPRSARQNIDLQSDLQRLKEIALKKELACEVFVLQNDHFKHLIDLLPHGLINNYLIWKRENHFEGLELSRAQLILAFLKVTPAKRITKLIFSSYSRKSIRDRIRRYNIAYNHFLAHEIAHQRKFQAYMVLEDDSFVNPYFNDGRVLDFCLQLLISLAEFNEESIEEVSYWDLSESFTLDELKIKDYSKVTEIGFEKLSKNFAEIQMNFLKKPATNTLSACAFSGDFSRKVMAPFFVEWKRSRAYRELNLDFGLQTYLQGVNKLQISTVFISPGVLRQGSLVNKDFLVEK